jgi:broad-specificity NMP kinase
MTILPKAYEELVEENHLSAVHDKAFESVIVDISAYFGTVEEIRVVRSFLELHCNVQETDVVVPICTLHQPLEVLGEG